MKGVALFTLTAVAAALLFTLAPGIDLWASGLFWRPGDSFFLGDAGWVRFLYRAVPWITYLTVGATLLILLYRALGFGRGGVGRAALYLLLALAIGPGLIANTILKDHWGRARPSQVTEFGGAHAFTPALLPTTECERNCSFVSGHAALGFFLVAFAFLVETPSRRRAALVAGLAAGTIFGIARIAQGGHFLSDVVFAGLIVLASSWLIHRVVYSDAVPHLLDRLSSALTASVGRWLTFWSAAAAAAILLSIVLLDERLARFCHAQSEKLLDTFTFITQFGLAKGWLIGAALLFAALRLAPLHARFAASRRRLAAFSWLPAYFFCTVAASGLIVDLVKIIVGRTRPKLLFADGSFAFTWWSLRADHWSFPSGHTANAVAIALVLGRFWPRWQPICWLFAILIAASRIIITQHYLSDVVAGAFIALVTERYLRFVFAQNGIDLAAARLGQAAASTQRRWPERLGFGRTNSP
jgi:lipid A 4'-phosphatase